MSLKYLHSNNVKTIRFGNYFFNPWIKFEFRTESIHNIDQTWTVFPTRIPEFDSLALRGEKNPYLTSARSIKITRWWYWDLYSMWSSKIQKKLGQNFFQMTSNDCGSTFSFCYQSLKKKNRLRWRVQ